MKTIITLFLCSMFLNTSTLQAAEVTVVNPENSNFWLTECGTFGSMPACGQPYARVIAQTRVHSQFSQEEYDIREAIVSYYLDERNNDYDSKKQLVQNCLAVKKRACDEHKKIMIYSEGTTIGLVCSIPGDPVDGNSSCK